MASVYLEPGEADAWRVRQINRVATTNGINPHRALTLIHNIAVASDEEVGRHIIAGTHYISLADLQQA